MAPSSPTARRRRGGRRNKDGDMLDPFWEYVLGDEEGVEVERSRKYFNQQAAPERSDSFLEYLFPEEGTKKPKKTQQAASQPWIAPTTTKSSKGKGFWRRKQQSGSVPSSSASWFSEDRNEKSTSREGGGGLFRKQKPPPDPFGVAAAKNSFDSFIDHYYNSDVETSEEEVVQEKKKPKETPKKKQSAARKFPLSKSKKKKEDSDSYLSSYLSWDGSTKKEQSRRLFRRKEKESGSSLSSFFPTAALSATGLASNNTKSSGGRGLSRSSSMKGNATSPSSSRKQESQTQRDRSDRAISPFDQLVDSLDVFGDNATSSEDEEFTSSGSSDGEGSSFESSFASTSYSYTTEVTDEDTSATPTSIFKNQGAVASSRGVAAPSESTPKGKMRKDVNEVRLRFSPTKKPASERTNQRALLPALDQQEEEDESFSPSGGLAGESVVSRSFEGSTQNEEDDGDASDERDDSLTISTRETLPPFGESLSYALPPVLPKSKSRAMSPELTKEDDSALERSRMILAQNSQNPHVGRIVCCSIKDLSPAQQQRARELGVAVHELSPAELEEIFPKVRSISEDLPLSRHRSAVIGNSKSFEKDFPAHLQAIVNQNGPQSLYEYEYEKGTHKVLVYETFGPDPRDLLRVHISDKPPVLFREGFLDDNKVIVQVEASTVSPTDCMIRHGQWAGVGTIPLPNSPGVDVVGKVYSIGANAAKTYGIDVGQRVMALTQYGGNARYLAVNAGQFVKVPESVDPAEAACLAETYLTAFQVLHFGQPNGTRYKKTSLKGKQLLIIGTVSSNMGRALSQLSSAASVDNLYATSKEKHYQRLTSLAILPLSLDPIHWFERLRGKIDLIISFNEEVTPLHFKVLRASGEVIRVSENGSDPTVELDPIRRSPGKLACGRHPWQMKCRINGYNIYNEWDTNLERCKKDLEHLIHMLDERWVVPEVLDRIPLNKVPRAQELIESKNIPGFIVCEPWIISKSRAVLL